MAFKKRKPEGIEAMSLWDRIEYKAQNEINNLSAEERDALEDKMIEGFSERITKITDEELLQEASERGEI